MHDLRKMLWDRGQRPVIAICPVVRESVTKCLLLERDALAEACAAPYVLHVTDGGTFSAVDSEIEPAKLPGPSGAGLSPFGDTLFEWPTGSTMHQ